MVYQPRERDDLVRGVGLLQQVRRSPMVANQTRDLLSDNEVASEIPETRAGRSPSRAARASASAFGPSSGRSESSLAYPHHGTGRRTELQLLYRGRGSTIPEVRSNSATTMRVCVQTSPFGVPTGVLLSTRPSRVPRAALPPRRESAAVELSFRSSQFFMTRSPLLPPAGSAPRPDAASARSVSPSPRIRAGPASPVASRDLPPRCGDRAFHQRIIAGRVTGSPNTLSNCDGPISDAKLDPGRSAPRWTTGTVRMPVPSSIPSRVARSRNAPSRLS